MGHTHYNEMANDGRTIYTTTRSMGQIEEGPPGFSITAIDGDVVSWKFKERGPCPFAMITSPSDEELITQPHSPRHMVRNNIPIRAILWGAPHFRGGHWEFNWNSEESIRWYTSDFGSGCTRG